MSYARGGYGAAGVGGGIRWDAERFQRERERMERGSGRYADEQDSRGDDCGRATYGGSVYAGERESYRAPARLATPPRRREQSADDRYTGVKIRVEAGGTGDSRSRFDDDAYGGGRARFEDDRPLRTRPTPVHYHEEDHEIIEKAPGPSMVIPYRPDNGPSGRRASVAFERGPPRGPPPPSDRSRPRPGMMRRQSSLDTFDRRPTRRYIDREIDIDYMPAACPTPPRPLPRMRERRASPPCSPPRRYEREYEEIRIAEPDYYGDDDYHGYSEREPPARQSVSRYTSRVEEKCEEPVIQVEKPFPRRGKTKIPCRLIERRAITALGYPFEQDGDTIIILKALSGDQIDEVVKVSEEIRKGVWLSRSITRVRY